MLYSFFIVGEYKEGMAPLTQEFRDKPIYTIKIHKTSKITPTLAWMNLKLRDRPIVY